MPTAAGSTSWMAARVSTGSVPTPSGVVAPEARRLVVSDDGPLDAGDDVEIRCRHRRSSQAVTVGGTGTAVSCSASMTRYSRNTSWAVSAVGPAGAA